MNIPRFLALGVFATMIGCMDTVSVDVPAGDRVAAEHLSQLVGRWIDPEMNVEEIRVTKAGNLISGSLYWDEATQKFLANNEDLDIRKIGDVYYMYVNLGNAISFLRLDLTDVDTIRIYIPAPDKFQTAVDSGMLTGKVTRAKNGDLNVQITADEKFSNGILFGADWRDFYLPDMVVLKRDPRIKASRTK